MALGGLELGWAFCAIAREAGAAILRVYETGFEVREKSDRSPVTEADRAAEAIICARLETLAPDVLVIAEERCAAEGVPSAAPPRFLLVDPLDGTREFLAKNGEFTVNIALIEDGRPVLGCVYAPALGRLYLGAAGEGAFAGEVRADQPFDRTALSAIRTRAYPAEGLTAFASRSHADPDTDAFLKSIPLAGRRVAGSSLKFCLLAAGEADVYPRFGPTMEWDTAAGQAVLEAAGGQVRAPDGGAFGYGKADSGFKNAAFIAWGGSPIA